MSPCYWTLCLSIALAFAARGAPGWRSVLWMGALVVSVALGLAEHVLAFSAVAGILVLATLCGLAHDAPEGWRKNTLAGVALVVGFAIAFHKAPGFSNEHYSVRPLAGDLPELKSISYDKGVAGLLMLAFLCPLSRTRIEFVRSLRAVALVGIPTIGIALTYGLLTDLAEVPARLPENTGLLLVTSLFFTVVAEEAAFHGVIQNLLAKHFGFNLAKVRGWIPILPTTFLFTAVNAGCKPLYLGGVTIAAMGYSLAFNRSKTMEAPIIVHFALNAIVGVLLNVKY